MKIKEAKTHLRAFMRAHYSDERLAWLLAHARSGKLAFNSCCCFIGVATANHALRRHVTIDDSGVCTSHYQSARQLPGAAEAEYAYRLLTRVLTYNQRRDMADDIVRQRTIIPMILAEMRRRERQLAAVDKLDAILAENRMATESAKELATA